MILDKISAVKTAEKWDQEYSAGRWDYLSRGGEDNNTAVIAGIINATPRTYDVIDIGCGHGLLGFKVASSRGYTGVDLSKKAISEARKSIHYNPYQYRFLNLGADDYINWVDAPPECLDHPHNFNKHKIIVFNEILYYLTDPVKTIKKYMAYFTDSIFIVSMYRGPRPFLIWPRLNYHFKWDSQYTVKNKECKWAIKTIRN